MTTIAVRDNIMACDSMESWSSEGGGDRFYINSDKIYPVYEKDTDKVIYLIGISGDSDGAPLFVEWYTEFYGTDFCDKRILKRMYEFECDAIILSSDGKIEVSSTYGIVHYCKEPFFAIGSGTKCALTAMHMGATAAEAVEVAKKVDPNTGGKVQVFRCD